MGIQHSGKEWWSGMVILLLGDSWTYNESSTTPHPDVPSPMAKVRKLQGQ